MTYPKPIGISKTCEIYVPIENFNMKFKDQDQYLQKQKKLKRMRKPCPRFILASVNIFHKNIKASHWLWRTYEKN